MKTMKEKKFEADKNEQEDKRWGMNTEQFK